MTTSTQTPTEALTARQARAELSRLIEAPDPAAAALIAERGPIAAYELITTGTTDHTTAETVTRLRARLRPEPLDLAALAADGIGLLTPEDPQWPETLHDAGDAAPVALWYRAENITSPLDRLPDFNNAVTITGTRENTGYGASITTEITAELLSYGHTTVTGSSYGTDAAALRAALAAENPRNITPTIAVMAGGVDHLYPAGNTSLLKRVAAAGLILSELAPGCAPTRHRLIRRNALLARLAAAVVIPEARSRSAAAHTAETAIDLHRPIAAVPGSVYSPASALPNALLSDPAVTAATSALDVGMMISYH